MIFLRIWVSVCVDFSVCVSVTVCCVFWFHGCVSACLFLYVCLSFFQCIN